MSHHFLKPKAMRTYLFNPLFAGWYALWPGVTLTDPEELQNCSDRVQRWPQTSRQRTKYWWYKLPLTSLYEHWATRGSKGRDRELPFPFERMSLLSCNCAEEWRTQTFHHKSGSLSAKGVNGIGKAWMKCRMLLWYTVHAKVPDAYLHYWLECLQRDH